MQNLKQQNLRLEDELFERKVEMEILTNDLAGVENILSLTKQNYVNEIVRLIIKENPLKLSI